MIVEVYNLKVAIKIDIMHTMVVYIKDMFYKRILVIDDEILLRNLLEEFLSYNGYKVDGVGNDVDAIKLLKKRNYHLIIIDYNLGDKKGSELISQIKEFSSSTPILGISGKHVKEEFIEAGADGFVSKPFYLNNLLNVIKKLLFDLK
ncbi:MAG: response regulator [Acidobacteriota bacterium]